MALQPVFKKGYIDYLKNHINPSLYMGDHFEYDRSQVVPLYGVPKPEGLLEQLDSKPDGDLQTAIAIYEAFPNLTPLFAQQDDLWVYLTHADLFKYVKERWPLQNETDDEKKRRFIENHWFHNPTNFLRTTFAGLWWNVFMTVDENREDKYELTKVMYNCGQDWRIMRFGELSLVRNKESMTGVLEFLAENPEIVKNNFDARGQFISRYFNILGGTKQLSALNRDQFKAILYNLKDRILNIQTVEDIHHKEISL
ncbi:MAG: hypothetical protein IJK93_05230 [Muribaculaceae bacterium]|nr:hypothetical protein [Muribaculaceae bacterium]